MNTMMFFQIKSERDLFQVIYNYYHLNLLTNPECSFVSNSEGLRASDTYSFSQRNMPSTFENFLTSVKKKNWDVCLCVAGTDELDSRRVVVTYIKDLSQIVVNFPSAVNGFSRNELQIKKWLENALKVF